MGCFRVDGTHPVHDGRIAEHLSRHIQSHHDDGHAGMEYHRSRIRIRINVKLCRRGHISQLIAAAHEHDLSDLGGDLRLHAHGHGNVRQRAGGHQGDIPVGCHQRPGQIIHRVFLFRTAVQRCKYRAVQTAFPVDLRGSHPFPDHGLAAALVNRHVNVQMLAYPQRIDGRLLQQLVAAHGGDAQKLQLRASACQQNVHRIIVSGITVQNHFSSIHFRLSSCLSLLYANRSPAKLVRAYWLTPVRELFFFFSAACLETREMTSTTMVIT